MCIISKVTLIMWSKSNIVDAVIRPYVAVRSWPGQQETSCKATHPQTHLLSRSYTRDVDYYWCLLTVEKKPNAWYVAETIPSPREPRGSSLCCVPAGRCCHSPVSQQTELIAQSDRPSLLHLHIYRWSWADFWSEHPGYDQDKVQGYVSISCFLFVLKAEKIQLILTEVCILTMTALVSFYLCVRILSTAFWRPKLLFYDWSAHLNSLVDQIKCLDGALRQVDAYKAQWKRELKWQDRMCQYGFRMKHGVSVLRSMKQSDVWQRSVKARADLANTEKQVGKHQQVFWCGTVKSCF